MNRRKFERKIRGVSLIELLIAMVIGSILLIGALTMFQQSRAAYRMNDMLARIQENGRFAMNVIEPDVRHANFWGLQNTALLVNGRRGQPGELAPIGGDCSDRSYIDLDVSIEGANGTQAPYGACIPAGNHQPGSDVLVSRHASANPVAVLNPGTLHLISDRNRGALFVGNVVPGGYAAPPVAQTFAISANNYYVSPNSSLGNGIPSLRRMGLLGGGPTIQDEEIIPGVEDFQVRLGVDTTGDGVVNRYVNTDNGILNPASPQFIPGAQVDSVRVWLRLRALRPEVGFVNNGVYTYADTNFVAPGDGFHRIVVSKTIRLRNCQPGTC